MPSALRIVGASLVALAGFAAAVMVTGGAAASGGSTPTLVADPSFNGGHPVELSFPAPPGVSGTAFMGADAVARLSSGKVLVGGYDLVSNVGDFEVARLNANGTLDTTFGSNGYASVAPAAGGYNLLFALGVQSDGKIVLAGTAQGSGAAEIALARLTANGALDTSFGSGGIVLDGSATSAIALAIDSSGRILVTGDGGGVHRYAATGAVDTGFGSGGTTASLMSTGRGIVLQPDGKIVVAGGKTVGPSTHATVARYGADGAADTGFGSGGVKDITPSGGNEFLNGVGLEGTSIVVAGSYNSGSGILLARLTSTGALDSTFGSGGRVVDTASGNAANAVLFSPYPQIDTGGKNTSNKASTCSYSTSGTPLQCTTQTSGGTDRPINGATQTCSASTAECTQDYVGEAGDGKALVTQEKASDGSAGTTSSSTSTSSTSTTGTTQTTTTATTQTTTTGTTTSQTCPGTTQPPPCLYDLAPSFSVPRVVAFGDSYTSVHGLVTVTNNGPAVSPAAEVWLDGIPGAFTGRQGEHVVDVSSSSSRCTPASLYTLYCDVPTLRPGDSVDFPIEARVSQVDIEWYNVSEVSVIAESGAPLWGDCSQYVEVTCTNNRVEQTTTVGASAKIATIKQPLKADRLHSIGGTASAPANGAGHDSAARLAGGGIRRVQIALVRLLGKTKPDGGASKCAWVTGAKATFSTRKPTRGVCLPAVWLRVHGTRHWIFRLRQTLPPGKYVVYARATRTNGVTDQSFSPRQGDEILFRLR